MKAILDKICRPCRSVTDQFIIAAFLSVLLQTLGQLFSMFVFSQTDFTAKATAYFGSDNIGEFISQYLLFFGMWISILLVTIIFRKNRPMLRSFLPNRRGNNLKGILAGLLLGFLANGFCILMSVLGGHIKLSYAGFNPLISLMFLGAIFIQSGAEEIVDRFYLYQKLRRRYRSPLVAIIVNSAVFMSLHMANPGFTPVAGSQIFLVGAFFSVLVYYYDSLWAAMWFHTAWNYTQNIIFGLPNSGIVSEYSIFRLEAASATNGFFYNVDFGVEGSLGASVVLIVLLIAIIIKNWKKPEKFDCWAHAEELATGSAEFSVQTDASDSTAGNPSDSTAGNPSDSTAEKTVIDDSDYVPKH